MSHTKWDKAIAELAHSAAELAGMDAGDTKGNRERIGRMLRERLIPLLDALEMGIKFPGTDKTTVVMQKERDKWL